MLRVGECAALDRRDFNAENRAIHIRKSKGDKFGRGRYRPLHASDCAILSAWLSAAGITEPDTPLFTRIRKGDSVTHDRISAENLQQIVRGRLTAAAQLKDKTAAPPDFTFHSFRVGSAQGLLAAGATLPDMMLAGRWSSPAMPAHYSSQIAAADDPMLKHRKK